MKNILITGGNGFVATYLLSSLSKQYNCKTLSRQDGIDITNYHSLNTIKAPIDILIHTAASMSNDFEESFHVNTIGTFNICKYAKEHSIKHLILISSLSVFDTPDNEYFNNYSRTKKQAEDIALAYSTDYNIKLTILRLSQVYDEKGLGKINQKMLYYFVDTIREKGKITLFGKTNPLRNYIHIEYLCDIIQEIIKERIIGTWNIVEEKSHTITEIAYMLFELQQKQPDITYLTDKANIPSVHIPINNNYKSKDITTIPLKEGLKRILNHDK